MATSKSPWQRAGVYVRHCNALVVCCHHLIRNKFDNDIEKVFFPAFFRFWDRPGSQWVYNTVVCKKISYLLRRQATNNQFSDPSLTATTPELTNWPQRTLVLERNGTDADGNGNQNIHSEKLGSLASIGEEDVHDLNPVQISIKHPSRNRVKRAVSWYYLLVVSITG